MRTRHEGTGGLVTSTGSPQRAEQIREGFAHLHGVDPVLAALIDERPDYDPDAWLSNLPHMDLFGCLILQIVGQQISVRAAGAIFGRLCEHFGDQVPSSRQLGTLTEQDLRNTGMSWRKARTALDLAARFADGRLSQRRLSAMPDGRIVDELTQITGIGPWTVHGALLIALRRTDVVPTGDIMLRRAVEKYYSLDHLPTEAEVLEIAERWTPHGSLGANLLFAALELDRVRPRGMVTQRRMVTQHGMVTRRRMVARIGAAPPAASPTATSPTATSAAVPSAALSGSATPVNPHRRHA